MRTTSQKKNKNRRTSDLPEERDMASAHCTTLYSRFKLDTRTRYLLSNGYQFYTPTAHFGTDDVNSRTMWHRQDVHANYLMALGTIRVFHEEPSSTLRIALTQSFMHRVQLMETFFSQKRIVSGGRRLRKN